MDISKDIHGKSVDMDMDGKFHIHGKPDSPAWVKKHATRFRGFFLQNIDWFLNCFTGTLRQTKTFKTFIFYKIRFKMWWDLTLLSQILSRVFR